MLSIERYRPVEGGNFNSSEYKYSFLSMVLSSILSFLVQHFVVILQLPSLSLLCIFFSIAQVRVGFEGDITGLPTMGEVTCLRYMY